MKKLLLTLLGVLLALPALARDFTYTYEGQTITYTVIDENAKTVSTKVGDSSYHTSGNSVSGNLILPSNPKDGNKEYTLTNIGDWAFAFCNSLKSVIIPNTVTSIGDYAFPGCASLAYVEIPDYVRSIGMDAFEGCVALSSISIPSSLTSIKNGTFVGCTALVSVEIPSSVTSIGDVAFLECNSLTSVTIPNSVTSIGFNAFSGCRSLTSVTIPNSVTSIEAQTFAYCENLTSVEIPNSVTSIGYQAFFECRNLTSVEIPNSVISIEDGAFSYCWRLTSIFYNSLHPIETRYSSFDNYDATLYVPEAAVETFKQTQPWCFFQNIQGYDFPAGVEYVSTGIDETAPCEYFTLSGVKAGNSRENLAPGIYIMRQGNASQKIVIK